MDFHKTRKTQPKSLVGAHLTRKETQKATWREQGREGSIEQISWVSEKCNARNHNVIHSVRRPSSLAVPQPRSCLHQCDQRNCRVHSRWQSALAATTACGTRKFTHPPLAKLLNVGTQFGAPCKRKSDKGSGGQKPGSDISRDPPSFSWAESSPQ